MTNKTLLGLIGIVLITGIVSCVELPPSSTTFTPTELRYRLLDAFPDYFWCDPDYYPIGSPERELQNALAEFESIRENDEQFDAIVKRLGLDHKLNYTVEEQLLVYRQHKLLTLAIGQFQPVSDGFNFSLRVSEGQGELVEGTIAADGRVRVTHREPRFNTCPICLARGTLIDTPSGPVAVEDLNIGMAVWTLDNDGQRIAVPVIGTGRTPVPAAFDLLIIILSDGRQVTASPGHPAADGKLLGNFQADDILDGSLIIGIETVAYYGQTYDILPAGETGSYWANGILLGSTLKD